MRYKITKLDRRYTYWEQFDYLIEFHKARGWQDGSGVLDFDRCRKWFNATYGWSHDMETRTDMVKAMVFINEKDWTEINRDWAYSIRYQEYRIYVNGLALTMFQLKWPQES